MTVNQNSIALSSDRGSLEIAGVSLLYEGTRVKSYLLGRDLNPMGRGDGSLYAEGMFSAGNTRPRPNSKSIGGKGNSVNNSYCPPGGGCGGGDDLFDGRYIPWINPIYPSPQLPDSGWPRESYGKELNPADCGFPSLDIYRKAFEDCDSIQDSGNPVPGQPESVHPEVDADPADPESPLTFFEYDCVKQALKNFDTCHQQAKDDYDIRRAFGITVLGDAYSLVLSIRWLITELLKKAAFVAGGGIIGGYQAIRTILVVFRVKLPKLPWVVEFWGAMFWLYNITGGDSDLKGMSKRYFNLLYAEAEALSYVDFGWCLLDNARRRLWNDYHDCLCKLHNELRKCVQAKCGKAPSAPSACDGDYLKDECRIKLRDCWSERIASAKSRKSAVRKYAWFYGFRAAASAPFLPYGLAWIYGRGCGASAD